MDCMKSMGLSINVTTITCSVYPPQCPPPMNIVFRVRIIVYSGVESKVCMHFLLPVCVHACARVCVCMCAHTCVNDDMVANMCRPLLLKLEYTSSVFAGLSTYIIVCLNTCPNDRLPCVYLDYLVQLPGTSRYSL